MFGCREEVTVMSRAADWPDFQQGRQTSPGRELFSAMRLRFSITGDNIAAEQAEAIRSRILSCFEIASPLPWQATAWSPNVYNVPDLQ